jgi:ribonuclease HI
MAKVFTDGACVNNGYPTARASWACVWPDSPELDVCGLLEGSEQTNNRAEFMAAIKALESSQGPLHIFTDSMLLLKIGQHEWQAKKNLDLVRRLNDLTRERQVKWTHVKAHTGGKDYNSVWNAVADDRAENLIKTLNNVNE